MRAALILAAAAAMTLAACSDSPTEPQVTSVQVTAPSDEVRVGETLQLTGTPVDAQGNEVPGRTLTWSSSNESRATVADDGLVTGVSPGQVTIMAQTGDASGQIILQVVEPPVASVEVVPAELELRRQQEVQLEVILRDADGNELEERPLQWSTEDAAVATVSAEGVAVGQGEGQTRIIASVDGVEGHTDVTVVVGEIPIIESISPEVLEPGENFTITGEKFAEDELEVRVHGAAATILTASGTSITARVPDDLCRPEGPAPILVFSALEPSDPLDHPYRPADLLELGAGEHQRLTSPSPFCVILGGTNQEAEYIMGLQSTSETAASRTSVRVEGFAGQSLPVTAAAAAREGSSFAAEAARRIAGAAGLSDRDLRWARHREAKPELRQAEATAMSQVRLGDGLARAARTADHPSRISADVQVGDTVPVNVPDINANICRDFSTIQGVIQRVGEKSIWVDDAANPAGGFTDADFELLADEFDNEIYDEVVSYFGEPTDLDDNDRIVIVNTRKVNEMSANVLGFVVSTDFFPDDCASSNGGEYYYSRVVDPDGSITDPDGESREYSRSDALSDAPLLLAHEVTHIIQFGRRFQMPEVTSLQEVWLLEGQATIAEEVVGHRYTGNAPGSNLDEFTAFSPADPTDTFWYRNPFVDLSIYYGVAFSDQSTFKVDGAPEECGWLSVREPEPCISGRIAYGVTWSLLRWISDHFGGEFADGEREIQRRIVDSSETGFSTFDDVLGDVVEEDILQLMAPWAASLYTEGRVETGDPLLTLPSWDLRSIESWISEPVRWGDPARLEPADHPFASDFQSSFVVAAGSSAYQRLSSDDGHPPFAVRAGASDGGPLPDFMQLWIARIR